VYAGRVRKDLYISSGFCSFRNREAIEWSFRFKYHQYCISLTIESKRGQEAEEGEEGDGEDTEEQKEKKAKKRVLSTMVWLIQGGTSRSNSCQRFQRNSNQEIRLGILRRPTLQEDICRLRRGRCQRLTSQSSLPG